MPIKCIKDSTFSPRDFSAGFSAGITACLVMMTIFKCLFKGGSFTWAFAASTPVPAPANQVRQLPEPTADLEAILEAEVGTEIEDLGGLGV